MTVTPQDAGDPGRPATPVAREPDARQRDRYRAVLLAMGDVERAGDEWADEVGRSPRFVDEWAARYRRGGLNARRPGGTPDLTLGLRPAEAAIGRNLAP